MKSILYSTALELKLSTTSNTLFTSVHLVSFTYRFDFKQFIVVIIDFVKISYDCCLGLRDLNSSKFTASKYFLIKMLKLTNFVTKKYR